MRGATYLAAYPTGWLVIDHQGQPLQTRFYGPFRDVVFTAETDADHVARALNFAHQAGAESVRAELRNLLNVPERKEGED